MRGRPKIHLRRQRVTGGDVEESLPSAPLLLARRSVAQALSFKCRPHLTLLPLGRYPEWLDFHHHVRAHYTAESLSADGLTWADESRHQHDATIATSDHPLTKQTMTHGAGSNFEFDIVKGTSDTVVKFPPTTFPAATFTYYENAAISLCTTDSSACDDFSHIIATEFNQHRTFSDYMLAGGSSNPSNEDRAASDHFLQACQSTVVADPDCGKYYDVFYPDFAALDTSFETALDDLFAGIAEHHPGTKDMEEYVARAQEVVSFYCGSRLRRPGV